MLRSGTRCIQVVCLLQKADQIGVFELMKIQISLRTSKEDLHIAVLPTDVAVIIPVVRCFTPLAFRIGNIELLGMEDVLVEDEFWMADLPCEAHEILCFVLPNETSLVRRLECVLRHLYFFCQLMIHNIHSHLLSSRNSTRSLIRLPKERMHLLSNSLLVLKWALLYYVCLLV